MTARAGGPAPLRSDAAAWLTVPVDRTVLAVAHNVAAAVRLFDVLPVLARDPRIQVVFTCDASSAFADGTFAYLARRGALTVPWADAQIAPVDIAITASNSDVLHALTVPLIALPHGLGYNKLAIKHQASSIKHQASSTKHQALSACRLRG